MVRAALKNPFTVEGAITLRLEQAFLQASYIEHIESRSLSRRQPD
jgi:hypothetical protein